MTAQEITSRFQPLMPADMSFAAAFPMPYQDEDGDWHEPAEDTWVIRIRSNLKYVDAMVHEADLAWPDELFHARILTPMLAAMEHLQ